MHVNEKACTCTVHIDPCLAHFVVYDVAVSLGGGVILKRCALIEQLIGNDPQGPPVTAHTIVSRLVQTRQNLRGDVFRCANWEAGLHLRNKVSAM